LARLRVTRRTKFPCRCHANPGASTGRRGHEQRHERAVPPFARLVDALELRSLQETTRARQMFARAGLSPGSSGVVTPARSAFVGYRQALPALRPAPLQNDTAILRGHPDAKAVRLRAAPLLGWYVRLPFISATVRPRSR
jgi:hypothetical protein